MKGTRLWQAPGSPIIQGRSRLLRPLWQSWLGAVAAAEGLVVALAVAADSLGISFGWAVGSASMSVVALALGGLPGAAAGAIAGCAASRALGWKSSWIYGALLGVLGAVGSAWLLSQTGVFGGA